MWPVEYRAFAFRSPDKRPRPGPGPDDLVSQSPRDDEGKFEIMHELGQRPDERSYMETTADMNCKDHRNWCATHKDACNEHQMSIMEQKCIAERDEAVREFEDKVIHSTGIHARSWLKESGEIQIDLRRMIGNDWMKVLCRKINRRELENMTSLDLGANNIDCKMLKNFLDAMHPIMTYPPAGWALLNMTELNLSHNNISDLESFAEAITRGALLMLEILDFTANDIGNTGLAQLTGLIANKELLPRLTTLRLSLSRIDDAQIAAFADQIKRYALRSLKRLFIPGGSRMRAMALGDACRRRKIVLLDTSSTLEEIRLEEIRLETSA